MNLPTQQIRDSYTIRVPSPDGEIFVHCTEDHAGKLDHIVINIGKAGSSVAAWADGLARMITFSLRHIPLEDILSELSNHSSSKSVFSVRHQNINSGVDAVFRALLMYRNIKTTNRIYREPQLSIPANW